MMDASGGSRFVLGYDLFRHQLVASLSEHQQHQQRVERQHQWRLQQQQRDELERLAPCSDGIARLSRLFQSRKQCPIIKGGHIPSSACAQTEDKHMTLMPAAYSGRQADNSVLFAPQPTSVVEVGISVYSHDDIR